MKIRLILAALFFVSTFTAFSQEDEVSDADGYIVTRFGAKAGVNFSTFTGGDFDYTARTGLHIGAFAHIPITFDLAFQPEATFSAQGYRQRFAGQRITAIYDYLNFPLMLDLRLGNGFSVQAGPQLGFNVTRKLEIDGEEQGAGLLRDANSTDFAVNGGLQYSFPEGLIIQARYSYGLTEVRESSDEKNSTIIFSVGYFFD